MLYYIVIQNTYFKIARKFSSSDFGSRQRNVDKWLETVKALNLIPRRIIELVWTLLPHL